MRAPCVPPREKKAKKGRRRGGRGVDENKEKEEEGGRREGENKEEEYEDGK